MMTNYNESVWRGLGHPAFDMDYELAIDDVEWWNAKDEDTEETDNGRRF
jgi:hypothetical protein